MIPLTLVLSPTFPNHEDIGPPPPLVPQSTTLSVNSKALLIAPSISFHSVVHIEKYQKDPLEVLYHSYMR